MPKANAKTLCSNADAVMRGHFARSIEVKQRVLAECAEDVLAAAGAIAASLRAGGKLMLCGNGGSAADCQHMAAELVGALNHCCKRPGLAAIALTTDSSVLTATANDAGYAAVFERQVQALARPGDVLLAISTSGNSENIVRGVVAAKALGIQTIALCGSSGGAVGPLATTAICVDGPNPQHIQEAHITIAHILCDLVERSLFPEQF